MGPANSRSIQPLEASITVKTGTPLDKLECHNRVRPKNYAKYFGYVLGTGKNVQPTGNCKR